MSDTPILIDPDELEYIPRKGTPPAAAAPPSEPTPAFSSNPDDYSIDPEAASKRKAAEEEAYATRLRRGRQERGILAPQTVERRPVDQGTLWENIKAGAAEGVLEIPDIPQTLWSLGKAAATQTLPERPEYLPSDYLKSGIKRITGYDPRDVPQSDDETIRLARAGAGGATGSLATWGVGVIPKIGLSLLSKGGPVGNVIAGGAGGMGGQYGAEHAKEIAPEGYEVPASVLGSVVGGVVGGAGGAATSSTIGRAPGHLLPGFGPKDIEGLSPRQREMRDRALGEFVGGKENFPRTIGELDTGIRNPLVPAAPGEQLVLPPPGEISSRLGDLSQYANQKRPGLFDKQPEREAQRVAVAQDFPGARDPVGNAGDALEGIRPPPVTGADISAQRAAVETPLGERLQERVEATGKLEAKAETTLTGKLATAAAGKVEKALDFYNKVVDRDVHGRPINRVNESKYTKYMTEEELSPSMRTRLESLQKGQSALDDIIARRKELESHFPVQPGGPHLSFSGIFHNFFGPGEPGAAKMGAYNRLVGNSNPEAQGNMLDAVVWNLRTAPGIVGKDGKLDHIKINEWLNRHDPAISQMPPNLTANLKDPVALERLISDQTTARAKAVQDYEGSAARFWLGGDNLNTRIEKILSSKDPVAELNDLKGRLSHDPAAWNGVKHEVLQHGMNKFINNNKVDGPALGKFANDNRAAIVNLYGPDFHKVLTNMVEDTANQQKFVDEIYRATTLKGEVAVPAALRPGIAARLTHSLAESSIMRSYVAATLANVGSVMGAILPAKIVASVVDSNRIAGINNINDSLVRIARDPALAKAALVKANIANRPDHPALQKFMSLLTTSSIQAGNVRALKQEERY